MLVERLVLRRMIGQPVVMVITLTIGLEIMLRGLVPGLLGSAVKRLDLGITQNPVFLGEMLTATAMGYYESEIARAVVLALFVPLIISSGGNSGSQATTLVIRAMAMTTLTRRDRVRMAMRELLTGMILGVCLASFSWVSIQFLFGRDWMQAGVVSLTIALVVTMGTVTGSLLPMFFESLGMDPAIMSNPLIASLSDIVGVVIYFSVAILLL